MEPVVKSFDSPLGRGELVTLTNASRASVTLSTLGAGIVAVRVPDRNGVLADVVIGYENPADYFQDGPCAGKIPGRYANRIARGKFSIDSKEYSLAINNGPNALHGGPTGFQNRLWTLVSASPSQVVMEYTSADGEEGYPGELRVQATYTWNDSCALGLTLVAQTTAPTVVNLTNHAYFNLAGHNSGTVLKHTLALNASRWLPTDETLIPLPGEPAPVSGTPMDFTVAKPLGRDIDDDFPALRYGKGYDNCFVVDGFTPGKLSPVAFLSDPVSGRTLQVSSTQPGVQIYTGNWLSGCPLGKDAAVYQDYAGVAIECQHFPDAPNRPDYPSTLLRPGETLREQITFHFSTTPAV